MRFSIGVVLGRIGMIAAIIAGGLVVAGVSQAQSVGQGQSAAESSSVTH